MSVTDPRTSPASWLVLCTAPEAQVRRAVQESLEGVEEARIRYAGPGHSPFAVMGPSRFLAWGAGPFSLSAARRLWQTLRAARPGGILLPLNNSAGSGYGLLRIFTLLAATERPLEVNPSGVRRTLQWKHLLPGAESEHLLHAVLIRVFGLALPLWRRWLKPYVPSRTHAPRPPLDPVVVQDHYQAEAPQASVVIRTFNEEKFIGQTLERVLNQKDVHAEVIVIDSGSTDRTLDIARAFPVRIYRIAKASFHYAAVLNLGARLARSGRVVNLSAHALPREDTWLRNLLRPLDEDSSLCGVFGRELPIADWSSPFEKKLLADMFGDAPVIRSSQFFFSNANSAIPRRLLLETPFDETVDWGEDQEWVHRMQERGCKTCYQPESTVFHSHNLSLRACFSRTLRFQRMLYARMYQDRVDAAHAYFRSQLPSRAAALRRFVRRHRLVPPGVDFLYASFAEYINFLGSALAREEWHAERRAVKSAHGDERGNGVPMEPARVRPAPPTERMETTAR